MSVTPQDLGLPYARWHPGQWETITALVSSEKPVIFLEAPTGSGKSGIVKALSRLLDLDLTILTGTLQLQDQYEETLGLATARGRANFPCQLDPGLSAAQGVCTIGGACVHRTYTRHRFYPPEDHGKEGCSGCDGAEDTACLYYWQSFAAERAPAKVLNYQYWLATANYAGRFRQPGLLVCDEAHSLDDQIRTFATVRISSRLVSGLHYAVPRIPDSDMQAWFEWAEKARDDFEVEYRDITSGRAGSPTTREEEQRRRDILSLCRACDMLLCQSPDTWVAERDAPRGVTTFKPIWVSGLVKMLVTRHASRIIFMSGTILDPAFFAESLGLVTDQVDFIRVNSTFPVANRPLHYEPVGKVKVADEASVRAAVTRIDQIIARHPGQKGIIHTVSHKLANEIIRQSKNSSRMIGHVRENKAAQLDLFKRSDDGIWVSPSSGTGVDLPYDQCRWQVISKLPFPDLGDKQIKQAMKKGPDGQPLPSASRWYNWATACSLMQMVGRGVRAPDDRCDSYLIDGNWGWFRHYMYKTAPEWFLNAIRRPQIFLEPEVNETPEQMLAKLLAS